MVEFYTIDCPKCSVLEKKLKEKGIEFKTIKGEDEINKLGYSSAPLLKVDNTVMEFFTAVAWVNKQ